MFKFFSFLLERVNKLFIMFFQFQVCIIHSDMDTCRISIIGRLRTINVIVWRAVLVFSAFVSHEFKSTVGYYFVGVHVYCRACASLNHVNRKLLMMLTFNDFITGLQDRFSHFIRKQAQFMVCYCCSGFSDSHTFDKQGVFIQVKFTDDKIFNATHGLYPVKCFFRHFFTS